MARVSLSVTTTVETRASVFGPQYTDARCPSCNRVVMAIPGKALLEARLVANNAARSGRGPVTACKRCGHLVEIVVHSHG